MPAVAHGGAEGPIPIGAAEPRNDARPSWGDLGYSRERVHPRAPSAQENQAAPRDISLFWPPMVAPKYGPGAARPRDPRTTDLARKAGLLKEIARISYPIHTISWRPKI